MIRCNAKYWVLAAALAGMDSPALAQAPDTQASDRATVARNEAPPVTSAARQGSGAARGRRVELPFPLDAVPSGATPTPRHDSSEPHPYREASSKRA